MDLRPYRLSEHSASLVPTVQGQVQRPFLPCTFPGSFLGKLTRRDAFGWCFPNGFTCLWYMRYFIKGFTFNHVGTIGYASESERCPEWNLDFGLDAWLQNHPELFCHKRNNISHIDLAIPWIWLSEPARVALCLTTHSSDMYGKYIYCEPGPGAYAGDIYIYIYIHHEEQINTILDLVKLTFQHRI